MLLYGTYSEIHSDRSFVVRSDVCRKAHQTSKLGIGMVLFTAANPLHLLHSRTPPLHKLVDTRQGILLCNNE